MNRAEARQQARLLGWRGSKSKRQKRVPPAVQMALRNAVQARLAELEAETPETE